MPRFRIQITLTDEYRHEGEFADEDDARKWAENHLHERIPIRDNPLWKDTCDGTADLWLVEEL